MDIRIVYITISVIYIVFLDISMIRFTFLFCFAVQSHWIYFHNVKVNGGIVAFLEEVQLRISPYFGILENNRTLYP